MRFYLKNFKKEVASQRDVLLFEKGGIKIKMKKEKCPFCGLQRVQPDSTYQCRDCKFVFSEYQAIPSGDLLEDSTDHCPQCYSEKLDHNPSYYCLDCQHRFKVPAEVLLF